MSAAAEHRGLDAELLALAAEFHRCESRMAELDQPENRHRDGLAAVHEEWWSAFDRAFSLPAYTQAGWIAKASMLPAAIRDCGEVDSADSKAMMSLVRDMLGQAGPGPDADLLAACEAFQAVHRDMKNPRRGHTDADDEALGGVVGRWYADLTAASAIPARTARGQQAKARVIHTALIEAMDGEDTTGNREEFAAIAFLAELFGLDPAPSPAADAGAAPTDAAPAQDDVEALLAASEVADNALFDLETAFFDMRADVAIIGHIATSERVVGPEVWRRIEDHLDLAIDTMEETWKLAQERRHALRDAFKVEQAKRALLERARNIDAQPGSPADIEDAEALWTFMQNISRMVLKRHDEALPGAKAT
jgi:hypothetical protein